VRFSFLDVFLLHCSLTYRSNQSSGNADAAPASSPSLSSDGRPKSASYHSWPSSVLSTSDHCNLEAFFVCTYLQCSFFWVWRAAAFQGIEVGSATPSVCKTPAIGRQHRSANQPFSTERTGDLLSGSFLSLASFQREGSLPSAAGVAASGPAPPLAAATKPSMDDFAFVACLGRGHFGKVLLAEQKRSGQIVTIKCAFWRVFYLSLTTFSIRFRCLKKVDVLMNDELEGIATEKHVFQTVGESVFFLTGKRFFILIFDRYRVPRTSF
jgi:hypothetical protein